MIMTGPLLGVRVDFSELGYLLVIWRLLLV
jgi:hypothetical protein